MSADVVEFQVGGMKWRADGARADVVRRDIAERLDALETSLGVETIKKNLVRTVLRVPLSTGERVIVKRYAVRGFTDRVKYRFVPSRALAEWTAARGLAAAGVPTAVPVAMAELRDGALRDAALVVPEIPDALHLNAYIAERIERRRDSAALRARLYDDVVRIVRTMHDAGFVHRDLHGGNLLVNGPPESPRVFMIDLHSVRGPGRPSAASRRADMMKLLHSMRTCSSPAERAGMFRAWSESRGLGGVAPLAESELEAMERVRVKSRTARAMTRSSKFDVSRADGFTIHRLRDVPDAAVRAAISAHAATLAKRGPDVLKDGDRSALTRQTLALAGGARVVVVKQYRCASLGERMKNAVRRPRAVAAWIAGNGLLVRGFDAAEPLALATRGRGPLMSSAYLVMEALPEGSRADLVALARYAGALGAAARREKRELVEAMARLFRGLHAAGVYHGDLKAVNLFVRPTADGPRIVLADYDRVEFDRAVNERRRIKNLAQLSASVAVCVSLTDRLRFLREYAGDDAALAADWKRWFRGVVEECRRKIVVRMKPIE